jgi:uncharacterized protein with NRDE domain
MCTIAILVDVVDGAPLVIAANRDEMYARPTRPPERLVEQPRVIGGLDALSGGTWLAVRGDGRFAAVTNQRALVTPPEGLRSRGLAVKELAAADDPDAYVAALDPVAYASMNLVWNGPRGVAIAYARREAQTIEVERLGRGVHVLCNDRLGAPDFPRGDRLGDAIAAALAEGSIDGARWPALADRLALLLADHTRVDVADSNRPPHLPPELARELTATCIHSPLYGTRSSTIVAIEHHRVIDYRHADGPPCTTAYSDLRGLL